MTNLDARADELKGPLAKILAGEATCDASQRPRGLLLRWTSARPGERGAAAACVGRLRQRAFVVAFFY